MHITNINNIFLQKYVQKSIPEYRILQRKILNLFFSSTCTLPFDFKLQLETFTIKEVISNLPNRSCSLFLWKYGPAGPATTGIVNNRKNSQVDNKNPEISNSEGK